MKILIGIRMYLEMNGGITSGADGSHWEIFMRIRSFLLRFEGCCHYLCGLS